ncbi:uncharacterized protein LOC141587526 [Silene latifolia]|uniref:uncharacterized protein LOC141587526 n=1 Tax=Silene latifolia TaxID=37657 RepID=UPI003D78A2AA
MAPQIVNIAAMVPSKSRYQITARATRIWEVAPNQNAKPLSLDMVLLDTKGEHIHATIPQKWIRNFKDDIQEGRIYEVAHFEVAKNNRGYRPVHTNENLIKFTPFTSIIEQPEDSNKIEKHKFEFHQLDLIHERNNKTDYLIDVIGVLTGVKNKTDVRTEKGITEIRNIYIEDERIANPRTVQQIENNKQELTDEVMMANTKTLMELTEMELTDPKQTFTCQGVISSVRTDVEWRYISCPTCRKGLDADNVCPKCSEEIPYPTQSKSEASIVIFDKEAEKVIGKPIAKVLEIYEKEKGKQKVYEILQDCVGRQFTFKVMIGTSNYGDTRELKVVKTYLGEQTKTTDPLTGPLLHTPTCPAPLPELPVTELSLLTDSSKNWTTATQI